MKEKMKGMVITSTGAVMWGLNAVAGKYIMGTKSVDAMWMVSLRLICAGLILLGIAWRQTKGKGFFRIWKDKYSVLRLLIVAIFAFAVCQATYFAAIHLSNAGITTAIQQTSPVFVLLSVLVVERRFPKKVEVGVLLMVIIGAFVLATGGDVTTLLIPAEALLLGLISAITCAMYTVLPAKLIERYGTFCTAGWGMLLGGLFLAPIAKLWIISGIWDWSTVLVFAFVVFFGTVVAFGTYLYGVTLVGPLMGSVIGLLEPVVATLASVLILHQVFTKSDIIGIAAILGGVTLLSVFKEKG